MRCYLCASRSMCTAAAFVWLTRSNWKVPWTDWPPRRRRDPTSQNLTRSWAVWVGACGRLPWWHGTGHLGDNHVWCHTCGITARLCVCTCVCQSSVIKSRACCQRQRVDELSPLSLSTPKINKLQHVWQQRASDSNNWHSSGKEATVGRWSEVYLNMLINCQWQILCCNLHCINQQYRTNYAQFNAAQ